MGYYAAKQKYLGKVSKMVTISYPKSESGGSKSVVVEEPVYVDVYVESDPFEHSVDHCDNSLHLLQAGIVAAEAAEKQSRLENSQRLGKSLDEGFFQVVTSNLTMQAKEESATAKALVGALYAQQKQLLTIKDQMENDYNLIKSRYVKLFEDYDKELRNRIYALNKRVFELVDSSAKELERPTGSMLMAAALVGQKENLSLQTKITASRVKYFASLVIGKVKEFIEKQNVLRFRLRHITSDECSAHTYYVPVMCMQTAEGERTAYQIFSNKLVNKNGKVASELEESLMAPPAVWGGMPEEDRNRIAASLSEQINASFSDSARDRRIAALILKLWQNNVPKVLNK